LLSSLLFKKKTLWILVLLTNLGQGLLDGGRRFA
jgi:hypothetical protein